MIEALIVAYFLVLSRLAAFVMFLPPIGGRSTPHTVKIGLIVGLTCLLAPLSAPAVATSLWHSGQSTQWLAIGLLVIRESLLGAGLAWLCGLALVPARVAGAYVTQEMGLTLGSLVSPVDDQSAAPLSQAWEALAVILMFTLNVHHFFLAAIGFSFRSRPAGGSWSLPSSETAIAAVSRVETQGLLAIAPIGLILFVTLIVVTLTLRLAPQFNFMSVGMTVRLGGGLLALLVFFPEVLAALQYFLQHLDLRELADVGT